MTRVDMSPGAISTRLRELDRLADLRPAHRLDSKIEMSARAVSRRLRQVGDTLELCRRLAARKT